MYSVLGSRKTKLQLACPHNCLDSPGSLQTLSGRKGHRPLRVVWERNNYFCLGSTSAEKIPNSVFLAVKLYFPEGKRTPSWWFVGLACAFLEGSLVGEGGGAPGASWEFTQPAGPVPWHSRFISAFWNVYWLRLQPIFPSPPQCSWFNVTF